MSETETLRRIDEAVHGYDATECMADHQRRLADVVAALADCELDSSGSHSVMTMSELCRTLRQDGLDNAVPYRIRHAVEVGYIDRPPKDAAGNWQFNRSQVRQVKRYLENVPRPGRKTVTAANGRDA